MKLFEKPQLWREIIPTREMIFLNHKNSILSRWNWLCFFRNPNPTPNRNSERFDFATSEPHLIRISASYITYSKFFYQRNFVKRGKNGVISSVYTFVMHTLVQYILRHNRAITLSFRRNRFKSSHVTVNIKWQIIFHVKSLRPARRVTIRQVSTSFHNFTFTVYLSGKNTMEPNKLTSTMINATACKLYNFGINFFSPRYIN